MKNDLVRKDVNEIIIVKENGEFKYKNKKGKLIWEEWRRRRIMKISSVDRKSLRINIK